MSPSYWKAGQMIFKWGWGFPTWWSALEEICIFVLALPRGGRDGEDRMRRYPLNRKQVKRCEARKHSKVPEKLFQSFGYQILKTFSEHRMSQGLGALGAP